MVSLQSCVQQGERWMQRAAENEHLAGWLRGTGAFLGGFVLSGAALGNGVQPFFLGLLCAMEAGWPTFLTALGSGAGSWWFWGADGIQGIIWAAAGLMLAGLLGSRAIVRRVPLLMPACAMLIVSASGLAGQMMQTDLTPIGLYLLRVGLAWGSTRLFQKIMERQDTYVDWAAEAVAVLALTRISVTPWLNLGYLSAAALAAGGSFPAAALAGVALDLAQITRTPMTAVLCLGCAVRLLPRMGKRLAAGLPGLAYLLICALWGSWDLHPLPGLLLGGCAGLLIPAGQRELPRRGGIGIAQVRLEQAAGVFARLRHLLLTAQPGAVDETAILQQAVERACGTCPCRKGCRDREAMGHIPVQLLHRPQLQNFQIPIPCRKVSRVTEQLQRGQEQLRTIQADREIQSDYREAVVQQYGFLSDFLSGLSKELPQPADGSRQRYQPEVAVCSVGREQSNGDRCLWFMGTGCRYYVLLCDGMGTGLGAAQESKSAGQLLRSLLSAGFPAEYALRTFNSLCALRGQAGAATVDLTELELDTGLATVYKWGAAPSYLLTRTGTEKIGAAGAPPGLSVTQTRETADRLSLHRGESLVMLSDGADETAVYSRDFFREAPAETAAAIIEDTDRTQPDDATAVVIRLSALPRE